MRVRRSCILAITAGGALLLAACGGGTGGTRASMSGASAPAMASVPHATAATGPSQASAGSVGALLARVSSAQAPAAVIKVRAGGEGTAGHVGAGKPLYSKGFHIWNLTSYPLTLDNLSDGDFEGRPDVGHVLMPGTYDDFEVTWYFFKAQQITATYTTSQNGAHMSVYPTMRVSDTSGTPASWCSADSGLACTPTDHEVDQTTIMALDPPGTVREIPASQGQAQAAALKQLCIDTSAATCAFTATGETHVTGAEHQIGVTLRNKTTDPAEYKLTCADTVGHTDSVGVDVSAGGSLFHIVDVEVHASYGHEWIASHEFSSEVTFTVKPGEKGWVTDAAPLTRDTGDFTITMGNTTWHLRSIYFDSPDPGGNPIWTTYTQPITGGPVTKIPNTTAPATAVVTGDDCTSA